MTADGQGSIETTSILCWYKFTSLYPGSLMHGVPGI